MNKPWRRIQGVIEGNDACFLEDLYVRGSCIATMMFALPPDIQRQDLSHEDDQAGILKQCRDHGILVEPGQISDASGIRIFRGWRLDGQGCPWASLEREYSIIAHEDGTHTCSVCGQQLKGDMSKDNAAIETKTDSKDPSKSET
jgi:hypothetical protein